MGFKKKLDKKDNFGHHIVFEIHFQKNYEGNRSPLQKGNTICPMKR
jgi:hypothetical protein